MPRQPVALLSLILISAAAMGNEADVIDARGKCSDGSCVISATVRHDDSGWDHYADHWRVLAPDGTELGRRVLMHPHEEEQPFTRSLSGLGIPKEFDHVFIEAHDKVHGYGGQRFRLELQ